jgi:hypothetical protein
MREILFRGKFSDNGNWIEGSLIVGRDLESGELIYLISPLSAYYTEVKKVMPESVSEFTGLTDKNGTKIFEGDILVFCKGATHPIKVYWDGLGWKFLRNGKRIEDAFECNIISHIKYCEVIGNIHDNPELLKGE